jgi:Spy/CpxP family protein refolding chaperone
MKRLFLPSVLSIMLLASPGLPAVAQTSDDDMDLSDSPSSTSTDTTGAAPAPGHHQHLLAQLDLTDAQKAQIKQIVQGTTDKKERRQQIRAILTPDQKIKLRQLIRERRAQRQAANP